MNEPPPVPPPLPTPRPVPPPARSAEDEALRMVLLPVGRSGWAIAAGYLGLFSILLLPGPFAIWCGMVALKRIDASQQSARPLHGRGRAIFGIIAGMFGTLGLALVLLSPVLGKR